MTTVPWDVLVAKAKENGHTEVAPVGVYQCRIEAAEAGENQNGNAFIETRLKITEGEHAGKRPTTFYHKIYQTEKTVNIFMQNMKAFGITDETVLQQRPTLDQVARAIIGKTVTVKTKVATDNRKNNEVKTDREGNPQVEVSWSFSAPRDGAVAVTEFPPVGGGAPTIRGGSTINDPGF
jgi:uncharacterized protein DUF669